MVIEIDKLWFQIIDLENSIRNHNNRIEDLEVEKMKLENEVVELKRAVEQSPTSDQLLKESKDQLEIEVTFIEKENWKVNQSDPNKTIFDLFIIVRQSKDDHFQP